MHIVSTGWGEDRRGSFKEAMSFYSDCLDGQITLIQTFGESPVPVDEESKDRIFNSEMRAGPIVIKASDDLPNHPTSRGSNFSLFIECSDGEEKRRILERLSTGEKILFPIEDDFSMLRDKFGIQWMFVSE